MPKLRHYDHLNTARFITFTCFRRRQLLTSHAVIVEFLTQLNEIRRTYCIKLHAYVVMPEHVHLVLHPPDSLKLGPIIGELKSKSASRILQKNLVAPPLICTVVKDGVLRRAFWQPRCYDHNCRSRDTVIEKIAYCHMNPVQRGLVNEPVDWRWSSFNWYQGSSDVPLEMDELEI